MMKMIRLRSSPAFTMARWTTATIILFLILSIASIIPIAAENNDDTTSTSAAADVDEPKLISTIEINLPVQPKRHRRKSTSSSSSGGGGDDDDNENCQDWAEQGECTANPGYMLEHCAASCAAVDNNGDDMDNNDDDEEEEEEEEIVIPKGNAYIYDGEDAAVGAFRFAEQYSRYYTNGMIPIPTVLHVAHDLLDSITTNISSDEEYTPPQSITHCGGGEGNKKSRPCSAGKLWKRAEDMRKADVHDEAGADLIRALLKSGIEVDFKEKCERSLQWALGSVRKQRERERRQALEDAKLEERRQLEKLAMEEAEIRRLEYESNFEKFTLGMKEQLSNGSLGETVTSSATVGADGSVDTAADGATKELIESVVKSFVEGAAESETIQLLKKMSPSDKTVDILLIEARCHESLGNHQQALSAAGKLIAKAANHDPWLNDSPRMLAATLGANAAMQLGLSDNALSFYQAVLKFDPEQERARKQYRGLKKVVKMLNKAEEQIQQGYNKKASEHVDDCLSAMRGLDVDSPLFRSKIQLKQCTILSGMGKYEEALDNCDTAVELREQHGAIVSAESRKEAHLVRAEALLLDMDYDEAVSDFRIAFDLVPEDDETGEKRELHHKLQQAMHQQKRWNGGEKDYHYNENTGYPDGRPPERDHAKILQLPIDLENRTKEIKCAWLKKQFKALVRQYHPDKYKGNKKRAARKFKEVKEAKEIISSAWDC
jgi:tetratricopeptide (TPR) repeat protein